MAVADDQTNDQAADKAPDFHADRPCNVRCAC